MALIDELKRRKVFKVGAAYLVVAWLAVQAASIGFPAFDAPPWALRIFILVTMIGFPVAAVMAWVFDVTPEGVQVAAGGRSGRGVYLAAGALVALALAWYFYGQPTFRKGDPATPATVAAAPAAPSVDPKSIAVLPFVNMSGKPDEEYFSDGMTEELLNVLAQVPELKVAARTSVFAFKGKEADVREIGQKLGVAHLVEGSIRREGGQVRVTAQLVRVSDGFHVWSESYDRELKSVFALQDELAGQIGAQLRSRLGLGDMPAARAAIDPEAYDEYLKGRALYRVRKDLPGAVSHLRKAVERAPAFGAGWASLALAHEVVYWTTTDAERRDVGDSYAELVSAAERATVLEPDSAMTLHARGNVARAQGRYVDALKLYRDSIAADQTYPNVREDYGELLVDLGRQEEGEAAIRELLRLDPAVALYWWRLGALGISAERPELVQEAIRHTAETDMNYRFGQVLRILPALTRGDIPAARTALAEAQKVAPEAMATEAVMFHWAARDPGADDARARALVEEMTLRGIYALVRGDIELFLKSYDSEAARMARHPFYISVSDPVGRRWFGDPRVKQALVRFGFVAYWREAGWPPLCRPTGADDFECDTSTNQPAKTP